MLKVRRLVATATAVVLLCLGGVCMPVQGATAKRTQVNHAYVPYEWCSAVASEELMDARLDELQQYGIDVLLCDIGCYRMTSSTSLSNTISYANLGAWIAKGHERGMKVLACINYAINAYTDLQKQGTNETYHEYIRADICRISKIFTVTGVEYQGKKYVTDGVQMDVEPFRRPYQERMLELMRAVREVIGKEKMLSMASPAYNGIWSNAYAAEMIEVTDMLCPMVYDTVGPASWGGVADGVSRSKAEYVELTKRTCTWYSERIAASNNTDCILSITTPVYDDRKSEATVGYPDASSGYVYYHLNYNEKTGETIEKLENCLLGIRAAIDEGAKVDGAGVFYWPAFVGTNRQYQPTVNPYYDYAADQQAWKTLWLAQRANVTPSTASKSTSTTGKTTTRTTTTKGTSVTTRTTAVKSTKTQSQPSAVSTTTSTTRKTASAAATVKTSVAGSVGNAEGTTSTTLTTGTTGTTATETTAGTSAESTTASSTAIAAETATTGVVSTEKDDTEAKNTVWMAAAALLAGGVATGVLLWRKYRKEKNR